MTLKMNGKSLDTDEEGFLLDPAEWNESVAQLIADGENLELNSARWKIVRYVREHFEQRGTVPEARVVLLNPYARNHSQVAPGQRRANHSRIESIRA